MRVLLIFFSFASLGAAIVVKPLHQDPQITRRVSGCALLLSNIAPNFESIHPGRVPEFHAGSFRQIDDLLEAAGASKADMLKVLSFFNFILFRAKEDPDVRSLIEKLIYDRGNKLLICVADQACRFRDNAFAATFFSSWIDNVVLLPLDVVRSLGPLDTIDREPSPLPDEDQRIIAMPFPKALNDEDALMWVVGLLHEGTHYDDALFFKDWAIANAVLLDRGRSPDKYFQSYARDINGVLTIAREFYVTFSESRAYGIMTKAATTFLTTPSAAEYSDFQRLRAYEYLRSAVGPEILSELGVTPKNVLNIWQRVLPTMKATIAAGRP